VAVPDRIADLGICDLANNWGLSLALATRLSNSARDFELETRGVVEITSGLRTPEEQNKLRRQGRPTAPNDVSTHLACPSTGADVTLGFAPTRVQKAIWGRIAVMNGLRWGGGGAVDPGGIPIDWQHVDLGPRHMEQIEMSF